MSCLLIPRGVELQLGSIMIDIPRIILTLFTVMAINQLLSGNVRIRITVADFLMIAHTGIITFTALYHEGFDEGLEIAIATIVDMGMAYFVARVAIMNLECYRYYVRIALIIAAIASVFAFSEMITGYSVIRAVYQQIFPKVDKVNLEVQRLSLYRAYATFRGDILFGLYCMIAFALAVCLKPADLKMSKVWYRICLVLSVVGIFSSLSSGPWLAFALCLFCLAYDHIMRKTRYRWKLLLLTVIACYVLLSFLTNRGPIKLAISYLTLQPQTGYVRLAMWECIWSLMADYWPLGWGWSDDWPRAVEWYFFHSVDSFYAVLLLRSGIFAALSIVCYMFYCWYRMSQIKGSDYRWPREVKGWIISTVCLFFAALTVHIFGSLVFATFFLLGIGPSLAAVYESPAQSQAVPG